jgi:hypothetical protein
VSGDVDIGSETAVISTKCLGGMKKDISYRQIYFLHWVQRSLLVQPWREVMLVCVKEKRVSIPQLDEINKAGT